MMNDERRITRIGAGAGIDAPCPAGRDLVNLDFVYTPSSRHSSCKHDSALDFRSSVNYCAARISVRVRGRLNLVDFSPAAEPGVFFYYRKIRKELKNTETFLRDGEGDG